MPRSPKNTKSTWSVQDAKNKFSAVLKAAQKTPQTVTRHGEPAAVVISAAEYEKLKGRAKKPAKTFVEHLLSIPQASDDEEEDIFRREPIEFRDVEF